MYKKEQNLAILIIIFAFLFIFSSIYFCDAYYKTKHQLEDTYLALDIISKYQIQQEGVIKYKTSITTTDVIWAKSVLNTIGAEQGLDDFGSNIQPCY